MVNNAAGTSRANFSRETVKKILDAVQNAVPVRIAGMYLCNLGLMFKVIFPIVRMFMKEKMRKRMNKIDHEDDLLKFFPQSTLPTDLNGDLSNDHEAFVQARLAQREAAAAAAAAAAPVPTKKEPAKVIAL
jgi:hypothetical protein